jgi:uncharacterized protein (DUF58 family)
VTPTLATRGRLLAVFASLLVGAGAIRPEAWPLLALGVVVAAGLCAAYLAFFPTAIYLRRHKVELAWWVPPGEQPGGAVTVDHPFALHVALRNHGRAVLRVLELRVFSSSAIDPPGPIAARVAAGYEVEVAASLRARACGHWTLHGALVRLSDLFGLFELRAYFPNPVAVKVFPKLSTPRAGQVVIRPQVGALHERLGVHTIRRRGLAGDLREIREHAHGDAFKFIAWKATARRRQLMVRELESEIVVTHQVVVDIAGSMRAGGDGRAKLDYAIETAAGLARAALEGGDRVGLCTFDSRIYGHLKPGEGRPHYLKILDRLLETRNVVDEDLTDLTDGELVAAVARYLLAQEAVDVRVVRPPSAADPLWGRIAAGPGGELYDMGAISGIISSLLRVHGAAAEAARARGTHAMVPTWWSRVQLGEGTHPEMARLRLFCRLRGIELPYRPLQDPGRRAVGFAEALARATASERSQFVVVVSDLEWMLDDPRTALRALKRARRKNHHVICVAPFGPLFAPPASTTAGRRVAEVLTVEERRRLDVARHELSRLGVPVVTAGPEESIDVMLRRMARARALLRGRA